MRIIIDTSRDIAGLFEIISHRIRKPEIKASAVLDDYITVLPADSKVKTAVAEAISEYIIKCFEREIALEYIKQFELLKHDVEEILGFIAGDSELRGKRLELLTKEVAKYVATGRVNVDGLVRFRLDDYKEELKFAAEMFIDEMSVKKSYDEFIGLMRYFTEIQTPATDTVILTEDSGEYKLTDEGGNPLKLRFDEEFADELMPVGMTGEDLLISNLMAAMPKKIVFDNVDKEKPIINTISRIFEGRISY